MHGVRLLAGMVDDGARRAFTPHIVALLLARAAGQSNVDFLRFMVMAGI